VETQQPTVEVDRTSNLLRLLVKIVFVVVAAVLAFVGIWSLGRGGLGALGATFSLVVAIALLVGLYFLMGRVDALHLHPAWISAGIFVLAFVPRLVVALSYRAQPWNDFLTYYTASGWIAKGETTALTNSFFTAYPDQIGIAWFQGMLQRIIGPSPLALQVFYSMVTAAICVVIYLLVRHVDSRAAILAGVIYAIFPPNVIWPTVLTDQHFSTLLCLLAFLSIVKATPQSVRRRIALIVLAGVLLGVGNLIRPEVMPYVGTAAIVLLLWQFTKTARSAKPMTRVAGFAMPVVLVLSYFVPSWAFYGYLHQYGVSSPSSDLRMKFVVGLDFAGGGTYSEAAAPTINAWNAADESQRKQMFDSAIKSALKSPVRLVKLAGSKMLLQYGDPDPALAWSLGFDPNYWDGTQPGGSSSADPAVRLDAHRQAAYTATAVPSSAVMLLLAAYAAWRLRRRISDELILLLVACFAVRVLAYCLIEVQGRYRYFDIPTLTILAALGLGLVVNDARASRLLKDEDDGADPATPLADARSAQDDEQRNDD